jgi:hypothetical protein
MGRMELRSLGLYERVVDTDTGYGGILDGRSFAISVLRVSVK